MVGISLIMLALLSMFVIMHEAGHYRVCLDAGGDPSVSSVGGWILVGCTVWSEQMSDRNFLIELVGYSLFPFFALGMAFLAAYMIRVGDV